MEVIFILFVAVIAIAIKVGKTASRASGAARGGWSLGQAALRRLRKERDRASTRQAELRDRWRTLQDEPAEVEPPPLPDLAGEEAAEAATVLEEVDLASEVLEELEPEPESVLPVPDEPVPDEPVPDEPVPDEPDPQPWPAAEPTPPEDRVEPRPAPEPAPTLPAVPRSDPADLAQDLFVEGRPGFEVARRFEEEHRGQRVRWRGIVERAEPFRGDPNLGAGPGTRLVAEVVPAAPSARPLRLEVGLAPGLEGALERGQEVEVEGTLSDCDPYLLGFRLADGRLV